MVMRTETIYLILNQHGVARMTKRLPPVGRDEVPVKLHVRIDPNAFQTPVLERTVEIVDWRGGVDLEDVQFTGTFITEEEANIIRARRLAKMREILEGQGYSVSHPSDECTHGDGCPAHPGGIGCDG
jgi:hypothetical protein